MADFDYNVAGQEYLYKAEARPNPGRGFLSTEAIKTIEFTQLLIQAATKDIDARKSPLAPLHCAFDRLEGLILLAKRVLFELQHLPSKLAEVKNGAPCLVMIPSTEVFIDFSSLLYHAGSTLDILSRYYKGASGLDPTGYFRDSKKLIYNLQPPDIRADYLWADLDYFEREIDVIFSGKDGFKGLRNAIAHENSVLGMSMYTYSAHLIDKETVLIFDCEIEIERKEDGNKKLFPISKTVEKIISLVTWIVCRTAICYLTRTREGGILYAPSATPEWKANKFIPVWNNPLAIFSEWISDDPSHPKFSVLRATWNGFQTHNRPLNPEVISKAIKL